MAFRTAQVSFSKGIISPKLRARFDTTSYQAGAAEMTNCVILKEGGAMKRVGTRIVAKAYNQNPAQPVRLLSFVYSIEQAYVLEMGQGYMRPLAIGGVVLEPALAITAITQAAQATVSCALHGYVVGDQIYFGDIAGMTQLNGKIGTVVGVPSANSYTIDIDTRSFGAFTGDSGGTTNTTAPTAPGSVTPPAPPVTSPPPPGTTHPGGGIIGNNGHTSVP